MLFVRPDPLHDGRMKMTSSTGSGVAAASQNRALLLEAIRGWRDAPNPHEPVPLASDAHYARLADLIIDSVKKDTSGFPQELKRTLAIIDRGSLIRGLCQKKPSDRPFDVPAYTRLVLALESVQP